MDEKLRKLFLEQTYAPEAELKNKAWQAIVRREKRINNFKLWFFSSISFLSTVGLYSMLQILFHDLAQSGIYQYISLAFSDTGSVVTFWKEFAFSIADALPIVSITLSLSLLFTFFLAVRYTSKQIIRSRLSF